MVKTVKMAEVTRGDLVESIHRGAVVVVDNKGETIAAAGDPGYLTYFRSAAKPLQALPVVESGAAVHFGLDLKEIALLTGSHSGEAEHGATTLTILQKIGLGPEHLQCGTHFPLDQSSREVLLAKGLEPTTLHCTCSGKHAGMLTLARYRGLSLDDYYCLEHPVQQEMLQTVAEMAGIAREQIAVGIDGCGVPVFALPLEKMAYAYARLAAPEELGKKRKEACLLIEEAMTTYPLMVGGTNRFDTVLLQVMGNKLIAKFGAEAVYCVGVPSKGWGMALKIEDGNERALAPVVLSVLEQLGLLTEEEKEKMASYKKQKLANKRGEIIGEIRAVVSLRKIG
ncbi:MAG: asparaginase [Clostridia bacterium]|nr:asparaginase [Clostridia bacterium]